MSLKNYYGIQGRQCGAQDGTLQHTPFMDYVKIIKYSYLIHCSIDLKKESLRHCLVIQL